MRTHTMGNGVIVDDKVVDTASSASSHTPTLLRIDVAYPQGSGSGTMSVKRPGGWSATFTGYPRLAFSQGVDVISAGNDANEVYGVQQFQASGIGRAEAKEMDTLA